MRHIAALLALFILAAGPAAAQTETVFPPANEDACLSDGKQYLSWFKGAGQTFCSSGQDILLSAIKGCAAGQVVGFSTEGNFVCRDVDVITAENCPEDHVLTYRDDKFTCVPVTAPAVIDCGDGEYLAHQGGQFLCVADNAGPTPPDCPGGHALGHENGQFVCVPLPVGVPTMVTPCSDAWRPPIPIDGDQGGVRAPLSEVGHLSVVT